MTQLLANELAEDDEYRVFVLSKSMKSQAPFFALSDRVSLHVLDTDAYKGLSSLIKDIFLLRKFVRKNKIDVLINVDVSLGSFSLPLKLLCPTRKQIFWEHFSFHYDIGSNKTAKLRRLALKLGDAYVALTPEDAEQFRSLTGRRSRVVSIPNICALDESEEPYDISSKKIVSLGNFLPTKGFDLAVSVAHSVLQKHPDWTWELYGDGAEWDRLHALVESYGLEERFLFKGRTHDLQQAYGDAAIFVLPSRSEGFGLVLIEAQAFHLPAVAFDVPYGPRNIIQDQKNGYLIPPMELDGMAEKICCLIEHPDVRQSFSAQAATCLPQYSAHRIASVWKELLGEIVCKNSLN